MTDTPEQGDRGRLARYCLMAAAAGHACAPVTGQIIGETDLNVVLSPNASNGLGFVSESYVIDAGSGFGEILWVSASAAFGSNVSQSRISGGWSSSAFLNGRNTAYFQRGTVKAGDPIDWAALAWGSRTFVPLLLRGGRFTGNANVPFSLLNFYSIFSSAVGGNGGFVPFAIDIDNDAHFGWIDIEIAVSVGDGPTLRINGWGLNTVAGEPILAGEVPSPGPGALALLALGAAGVRRSRGLVA
jgi:MYXO-CTERM domain-containing protein